MESPPMCSAWSGLSSEDSGLLLTSDSLSSCSSNWQFTMELVESEEDQKSLSSDHDSLELFDQFNTVKKGKSVGIEPIEPPLEFQDEPGGTEYFETEECVKQLASQLVENIVEEAVSRSVMTSTARLCCTPEPTSSTRRPASRNSLSSRLSSSHNSLSVPTANKADDSSFITSAMSHDVLTSISDMYNVPFDSDIYTLPVDSLRPCPQRPKRHHRYHRKRRRHTADTEPERGIVPDTSMDLQSCPTPTDNKRHSVPGTSGRSSQPCEPIHMTLQEVRQFLQNLYSTPDENKPANATTTRPSMRKHRKNTFSINIKHRKSKGHSGTEETLCINNNNHNNINNNNNNNNNKSNSKSVQTDHVEKSKKSSQTKNSFSYTLKQTLCNIFRFRRTEPPADTVLVLGVPRAPPFTKRALPPLPSSNNEPSGENPDDLEITEGGEETTMDFASSIEKVKDYGWYWGPISGETAEKILSNEPDGSFIVRDSSDDHYIFSLTFKLNGVVRHVRIEHDQGNFSFGSCTKFKSHTIVDFIENAVEHSRSGRYLFFLHRRPIHGPMRVQLLHPVSRFKQVQSLQHMCRFVILKVVRRDLISSLPLPRRIIDYLSSPHYYSEHPSLDDKHTSSPTLHVFSFLPPNS